MKIIARKHQKIITLILASTFFLLLFEGIARICVNNDWVINTTPQLSDTRWLLQWEKTHKNSQSTNYKIDSYNPTLGWYPLINARNVPDGKGLVNFNSEG